MKGDLNLVSMSRIGNILDSTKHFLIIVDGDVNIAANAGINNAVIVSYGKTLVAGMANIKGSFYDFFCIYHIILIEVLILH